MKFFVNIKSLADLKKQYRQLARENHPDLGGSTQTMQMINAEFEKLYNIYKDITTSTNTGYETDYANATASEYANYVYNEYRWMGRNYNGQSNSEIIDTIRKFLKSTYPNYKFSVTRSGYNSFYVRLMQADFNPFKDGSNVIIHDVNHYHINNDSKLNDRAKEIMTNITDFIMSYNYDLSDPMVDYFCTNFYLTLGIGTYKKPFEVVYNKLNSKTKIKPQPKVKDTPEVKAIKAAMGKAVFAKFEARSFTKVVLGEYHYRSNGEKYFYPNVYSGYGQAIKRINKLRAAGINCKMFKNYIEFDGIDPTLNIDIDKLNIVNE
jgi:curved DNA-binding protein CbpA